MTSGYRVWAEVYNADGERQAYIENVASVSVTRVLDGVGSVKLTLPGTDKKSLTYLTYEARVRVYLRQDEQTREIGRGIVRKPITTDTSGGSTFVVDCPDELTEFKDISVLVGRSYGAEAPVALSTVVESLVGLVDGWTADVEAAVSANLVSMKLDGVSVMKGLQELAENYGLHVRQSVGSKTLEFGAFGTDNGLVIRNTTHGNIQLQDSDALALIENLQITGTSENVVNRIYPFGGGEGLAAINLANSTRTSPYTIQSVTGPDGRTLRYIETGATPVREECRRYKITPIANSAAAKEVADDALYDAAAEDLARSSVVQETYRVVLAKVRQTVRAGDVVTLQYKGIVEPIRKGDPFVYRDVDGLFTVLEVNEDFSNSGVKTSLVISNLDRAMMSVEKQIVQSINDVKVGKFEVKTFPYVFNDSWELPVQNGTTSTPNTLLSTKTAKFIVPVEDIVADITKFQIRFETRRFAVQAALGVDLVTYTRAGLFFRALESINYPHEVTIKINGIDRTSELGGPWGTYTTSASATLDITEYIVNAAGGLYQDHTIEFDCAVAPSAFNNLVVYATSNPSVSFASGSITFSGGNIALSVSILGTAQSILVS